MLLALKSDAKQHMPSQQIVITGGPGAGKTTLLNELHSRGYTVVAESARAVIEARLAAGLSPRPPPLEFAQALLRLDLEKHQQHAHSTGLVFYDRSAIEALGMLDEAAPLLEKELTAQLATFRYHTQVFVLPPWEAIFINDAARDQSFTDAVRIHGAITSWYQRCGYAIIEVPRLNVGERADFVVNELSGNAA
jgi:predicted ATPase